MPVSFLASDNQSIARIGRIGIAETWARRRLRRHTSVNREFSALVCHRLQFTDAPTYYVYGLCRRVLSGGMLILILSRRRRRRIPNLLSSTTLQYLREELGLGTASCRGYCDKIASYIVRLGRIARMDIVFWRVP